MPLVNIRRVFFFVCLVCFVGTSVRASAVPPKSIVFFGDSLTAGYGLNEPEQDAFPALIQKKIEASRLDYRVVNAGLSGETTAAGLRRV
ncbi:MAG: SGNH/GDSL hydrolase family protein, partial [Opitutaceae bacterium]